MATVRVERPSVCPLDCPDTCSLTVTVEDDRIVAIRGSHATPYTGGVLCARVPEPSRASVHGAGRLRTPLRRVGAKGEGRFARITWAEALDLVNERFTAVVAEHGPQAILPLNYAGPHRMLPGGAMGPPPFPQLGPRPPPRPPPSARVPPQARGRAFALISP